MKGCAALAWVLAGMVTAGAGVVAWIESLPGSASSHGLGAALLAVSWAVTGALLLTARPGNAVGWLLCLAGVLQGWANAGGAYGGFGVGVADPMWPLADWVALSASMIYLPSLALPVSVILAVYPDGSLPSRRWRLPVAAVCVALTVITVGASLDPAAYKDIAPGSPPIEVQGGWWAMPVMVTAFALLVGGTLAIWVMTGFRLARAVPPQRPQLAWYAAIVVPSFLVIIFLPFPDWLGMSLGLSIPVAIAIGVLRYRMLDIVLRPAIVYGSLTLAVVAVFVGVTALAGSVLDRGPLSGVIAAALVAVGLAPARERLQRGADRFVYGERHDPLQAVSDLGDRVAAARGDSLLGVVVASVAHSVRAPAVRVTDASGTTLAQLGSVTDDAVSWPLVVAGQPQGTLLVAPRVPGDRYATADRRVLAALAQQVAVVVHALRLADALEAQRDRVVSATRAERDRLRREIHDGLGPALTGISLGMQATCDALAPADPDRTDPEKATRLLERMRAEVDTAVLDVRRMLDALGPSDLDERDLGLAVRRRAATVAPAVAVAVDVAVDGVTGLPPDVEVAAYRIAGEALTNVARHARAEHASVTLSATDAELVLRVSDDGSGIHADASAGLGLSSMRRRAQALGGTLDVDTGTDGTDVTARLPL